jgi:two-component system response regulator FixJ
MNQAKIYVIDDNQEFRESTEWMLQTTGFQVEGYSNPELALQVIENSNRDFTSCCLLDIRMPEMSGLEFHDRLKSINMCIPIIYMSGHGDIPLAVEAMDKGAVTFLEKPLDNKLLKTAIEKAFTQIADYKLNIEVNDHKEKYQEYMWRLEKLTDREREVLSEIVAGKMNKVIAIDLGISVKTVELHRSRVMSKMEATTAADLVKMVITEQVADDHG